jgi:hypothetical protein
MGFPVSEERIEAAERELGTRLLPQHRTRLIRDNGGEVLCEDDGCWQLHPIWDDTNRRTIARTTNHIVHETREAQQWGNFPPGAIVVASDGCGNHLVLRPGNTRLELWDHETGACSPVEVDWMLPS